MTTPSDVPLADPELLRTYFFVPGYERDPAQMHAFDLGTLFTGAAREIDPNAPDIDLTHPRPPGSVELIAVPYQVRGAELVRLDARTLHDSYMLSTGVLRCGHLPDGVGPPLSPHIPIILRDLKSSKYLGKLTIHAVEVPATTTPADLSTVADEYAARCGLAAGGICTATPLAAVVLDLNTAALGAADTVAPRCVVVYRQGADVKQFVRITLPELFLYHIKSRVIYHEVWEHDFRTLRDKDAQIRELLVRMRHPSKLSPDELLTINDDLTTELAKLVTAIADVENRVHTAEIARQNFTRAVAESGLAVAGLPEITRCLIGDWVDTLTEQADAALGYRRRTRDEARVHFESLQATARVHESRETRHLAIVMSLLTCAQVAGVVLAAVGDGAWPELLGKGVSVGTGIAVRLGLAMGCTGGLFYIAWRWLRRPG